MLRKVKQALKVLSKVTGHDTKALMIYSNQDGNLVYLDGYNVIRSDSFNEMKEFTKTDASYPSLNKLFSIRNYTFFKLIEKK